jgi:hypothetical protein
VHVFDRPFRRLAAAALAALLVLPAAVVPTLGWANVGDGYGTHDWILDQAFRLLDARGIPTSWVDRQMALVSTDDPDTVEKAADSTRGIEHVYYDYGRRGGAIHRITEHYAAMLRKYEAGRTAQLAGDTATATARFREASYNLGMLAHFYGDILVPYHTTLDGLDEDGEHAAYELLVNTKTRTSTASPTWSVANTSRTVRDMPDVRASAIAAAAYARARYPTLTDAFDENDTALSSTADTVTKEVLIRASGDLADLISSVPDGIGYPQRIASLKFWVRWHGVKANELSQRAYATVLDAAGRPIEGVEVKISWPMPNGSKKAIRFWTDATGGGNGITQATGTTTLMVKQTASATVTTDQTSITKTAWFYQTKKLADSSAGLVTTFNDRTVVAGQTITATTKARDTSGNPVAGLYIEWTWDLSGTTKTASGYTDASGNARTTFTVTSSTSRSTLYLKAKTSAYSLNRSWTASFYRVD